MRPCVDAVSPVYETPPWGPVSQPDYLNAVILASDDSAEYPLLADPLVLPPARWVLSELAEWDSDEWVQPKRPWRLG